jgi:hypothetical protein
MLEIRRGQLEPPFYICAQYPSKSRRVGLFVQPFQQSHPAVATLVANFFLYRAIMDSGRLSWLSSPSCFKCDVMVTARVQPRPLKQHVTNRLIRSLFSFLPNMLMLFFLIDFDVVYMPVRFDGWTAHCRHHKAYVVRSEYVLRRVSGAVYQSLSGGVLGRDDWKDY